MTVIAHNTQLRSKMDKKWRKNKKNKDLISVGQLLDKIEGMDENIKKNEKRIKELETTVAGLESRIRRLES
jgi:uncharacterized protein (DUF3084 family)